MLYDLQQQMYITIYVNITSDVVSSWIYQNENTLITTERYMLFKSNKK